MAVATLGLPLEMGTAQTIRRPKLGSATGATLEETLAAGLRCRRPEEFAFVKLVADRVEEGTLPRSLVEGTFFWARRQNQYPYISFRYALELRAKKLGLVL
ncbi:MAG: hypothetical protein SFX18_06195 [Pirellulales bacterium]|nr:hypothetical protein [Pirellulales bacterium]